MAPSVPGDYFEQGWWPRESVGELVRRRAGSTPDGVAYYAEHGPLTWVSYNQRAQALAGQFAGLGLAPGDRVAVYLPDSAMLHVAYLACERAGLIVVGIPARAGDRELDHLIRRTGARLLVTRPAYRGRPLRCAAAACSASQVRQSGSCPSGPRGAAVHASSSARRQRTTPRPIRTGAGQRPADRNRVGYVWNAATPGGGPAMGWRPSSCS